MPDDPRVRSQQERRRIDVSQEHECRYWSERFGVSPERLRQAVKEVGPLAEDVRDYLGK